MFGRWRGVLGLAMAALLVQTGPTQASEDPDPEVAELLASGYSRLELESLDDSPYRDDILNLFVAPYYELRAPRLNVNDLTSVDYAFVDINGDGQDELFIHVEYACEYDGCLFLAYSTEDGMHWRPIIEEAYGIWVAVGPQEAGQFPKLTVISPTFTTRFEYDGRAYQPDFN